MRSCLEYAGSAEMDAIHRKALSSSQEEVLRYGTAMVPKPCTCTALRAASADGGGWLGTNLKPNGDDAAAAPAADFNGSILAGC